MLDLDVHRFTQPCSVFFGIVPKWSQRATKSGRLYPGPRQTPELPPTQWWRGCQRTAELVATMLYCFVQALIRCFPSKITSPTDFLDCLSPAQSAPGVQGSRIEFSSFTICPPSLFRLRLFSIWEGQVEGPDLFSTRGSPMSASSFCSLGGWSTLALDSAGRGGGSFPAPSRELDAPVPSMALRSGR